MAGFWMLFVWWIRMDVGASRRLKKDFIHTEEFMKSGAKVAGKWTRGTRTEDER